MFRVNGLYGHIQRNNLKAAALFGAFLCLFVALEASRYLVPYLVSIGVTDEERGNLADALDEVLDLNHAIFDARAKLLKGEIEHKDYEAVQEEVRGQRRGQAGQGVIGAGGSFNIGRLMFAQFVHALPTALAVGALYLLVATWWNGLYIRYAMRARPLARSEQSELYNLVENLAIQVGMPCPAIELVDSPQLNAYASGLTPSSARIGVTAGLVRTLDRDELEAVIAHELTHIRSGDSRLMALTKACLDLITYYPRRMVERARAMTWPVRIFNIMLPAIIGASWGGKACLAIGAAYGLMAFIVLLAYLVKATIFHSREFVPDAGAIELTRNPAALISALRKIAGADDLAIKSFGAQAMLFSNSVRGLFSTHPSIESRVAAIRQYGGATAMGDIAQRARAPGPVAPRLGVGATSARATFGQRRTPGLASPDMSGAQAARRFETQAAAKTVWQESGIFSVAAPSEDDDAPSGDSLFERWVMSGRVSRVVDSGRRVRTGLARGIVYVQVGLLALFIVVPALLHVLF